MRGRIFWEGILAIILCQANMKTPKRGSVKIRVARTVASLCVQLSSGDKKSSTLTTCTTEPYILNLLPGLLAESFARSVAFRDRTVRMREGADLHSGAIFCHASDKEGC